MSLAKLEADLRARFVSDPLRLHHIYGVRDTALKLGKIYQLDLQKLRWAALLHDLTKSDDPRVRTARLQRHYPMTVLHDYPEPLHHAFDAVVVAREAYGIEDEMILKAIESHTLGRKAMSMIEKVIFVSDYIEPSRMYPSCVAAREQAFIHLDRSVYTILNETLDYLKRAQKKIPSQAFEALEYYRKVGD